MRSHYDILLVGQTPPPYHGQAVVTAMLFEHDWGDVRVHCLRMAYSASIESVGRLAVGKLLHLGALIFKTWWAVLTKRPEVLYYLPASANKAPVVRDILYLGAVRWCFPKTIFHYHAGGLPEYIDNAGWLGKLAALAYSNADLSVEICKTDYSPGRAFRARSTTFIPNGLDVKKCERTRQEDSKLRVLFMGALNEGKGVMEILESAQLLKARGCEVEFQLVGAWASEEFESQVRDALTGFNLETVVTFPGVLKGHEKWQAFTNADIFFFPTHYKSENFPLVIIEAMACGLPVVTTTWRGIPQLVGNSSAAVLCDIMAPEQYADAIEELANNAQRRKQMAEASVEHYEAYFTRDKFIGRMEHAFRDVLNNEAASCQSYEP